MEVKRKTNEKYWSGLWQDQSVATAIDPRAKGIKNYANTMFHKYFSKKFVSLGKGDKTLLEIGCANSSWLPYFKKELGFTVSGLDYSEIGCASSKKILEQSGVKGEVVYADMFDPPDHMIGRFDVVVSFGVAEHFDDTSKCLNAMALFLKKGGILVTNIPNMSGCIGSLVNFFNRPIYEIHNPLNKTEFLKAHDNIGCDVISCEYFMSTNFGVLNLNGIPPKTPSWWFKKLLFSSLVRISWIVWFAEVLTRPFPACRLFSPYIMCVAKRR